MKRCQKFGQGPPPPPIWTKSKGTAVFFGKPSLSRTCLHLEGVLLVIPQAISEKHCVRCINCQFFHPRHLLRNFLVWALYLLLDLPKLCCLIFPGWLGVKKGSSERQGARYDFATGRKPSNASAIAALTASACPGGSAHSWALTFSTLFFALLVALNENTVICAKG